MDSSIRGLVAPDGSQVSRQVFASEDLYRLEQQRIFHSNWLYLAHESQLKHPGDFVTAWMGETPVIVARGACGEITASINSCSHRGVPVCRADRGNTSRFVCPYHNWAFSVEGDLVAIPQERKVEHSVDKKALGLKKVPRTESVFGLIFGSLNPDIEPLEQYLGDMRFYMEAFFERFPGGMEIIGTPHKWLLEGNWKLPVENQLGDIGHAPYLHRALMSATPDATQELEDMAVTVVPRAGHAASLKLMPPDADPASFAWGLDKTSPPHMQEYLLEVQRTVAERLSPLQARIKGMSLGIYPNLSLLWGNATLRVSHPRGPGKIEYWSWLVLPAQAPDDIKEMLRGNYSVFFGPGGIIEQEDSYAWNQQLLGSRITYLNDQPYYYGLGMGEETIHPELPGIVGRCYNEHYARQFFARWREDMLGQESPS